MLGEMFRVPAQSLRDRAELKRRIDGERISDEALMRLVRHIASVAPELNDVVGVAADAILLKERPAWLEAIIGPRL